VCARRIGRRRRSGGLPGWPRSSPRQGGIDRPELVELPLLEGPGRGRGLGDSDDRDAAAPGEVAEAAFAVERSLQNQGIGTALLDVIVLAARNRGYAAIRVVCLRSNWAMRRLAQKAEARLLLTLDELHGEISAPRPTMLSWLREAFVDAFDTAIYTMRAPGRAHAA
jgi:GNAT superfamily N-acetyltransferase